MSNAAPRFPRCDQTAAWRALHAHYDAHGRALDLRDAFAADPQRFARFSQTAPQVFADLSKNRIDATTEALLLDLARQCGLEAHRDAMFSGEPVNGTEHRAAMHFLLRNPASAPVKWSKFAIDDVVDAVAEVQATRQAMLAWAGQVRADATLTDVVNIGIGGSDLGPQMAVLALDEFVTPAKRFHFVSNVDGHELGALLQKLKPRNTLFLIASKTFTTAETLTNARSARQWFLEQGAADAAVGHGAAPEISRHFVAITTHVAAANAFGIRTTFGFRDWVGGRYSVWSAIGLPLAIAIGAERFNEFLAGAHAMDVHFCSAPLAQNLPVRLGLLDVWYRNFHGFTSRNLAPYHSALRRFPAYCQQLEMESNGKRVDMDGQVLPYATAPVLWGEPGTNGQHAFFQMLHQGTDVIPVEFIAVKTPSHTLKGHHARLLANALAQAQALMVGSGRGAASPEGHRHFPGNRPSTFLLLDRLDPASLGALIALQEHRVFTSGAVWGLNSFDQWGVELGKLLAQDIEPRLASGDANGLDGSSAGLLHKLREK
ncbi:MAG: glucose-6-phosphate isomerase [Betaproteobacteria bacterium HGW-Betaproteobacteria-3]|jgi:glucose-6-phosphate isomerase|nr:MAG: glucose-6-phosphate isomerase [Betaproteobacteria bacterium HGW-Betaproteobacteria-3]